MPNNYNKSFNFRNGVQVDDDNFVVNSNGLVGIGTSVPRELLDVYGTAKVTGLVTTTNLAVTGISTFYSDVKVGSAITISPSTGAVSATAFYGNGSTLSNIVGYSTEAWIINVARTGISTTLNVGIGTTNPQYSLQVGKNPLTGNGFSVDGATGNVKTTGIITATKFSGPGDEVTSINASAITSGTLDNARLPSSISVSGTIGATSGFSGNLSGTASLASNLTGSPSINVATLNSTNIISGISSVGISTVSTRLYAESIGVGTNSPSSDIHIRRSSSSTLQITSDNAEAIIAIGRSTALTGNNGALRFGNTSALFPYSNVYSLDILNYGRGNINHYLEASNVSAAGTGSFYWHRKPNFDQLMTLTYNGNLGIGVTLPTNNLHVVGTSTVTSNSYVGNNLYVKNNLIINNDLTVNGTFTSTGSISANLSGNVTGNLTGNVNSSGLSTFSQAKITTNLGIGEVASTYQLEVGSGSSKVLISNSAIGINTTTIATGAGLDASQVFGLLQGVGVGTTSPSSYADFSNAGKGLLSDSGRFMLPPRLTTAERNALVVVAGAFIYNTQTNRHQGYNGTAWFDFY
jgi:hypothetical protein